MKKFLFSLFLVTFGFLFFNVDDVYAMTTLELEKFKDTAGFDESNQKSSLSEMSDSCSVKCWCLIEETYTLKGESYTQQVFYYNVGLGDRGDINNFKITGNSAGPPISSYGKFVLDGIPELTEKWKWTDVDIQKYLLDKGYCRVIASSGQDGSNAHHWVSTNNFYYDSFGTLHIQMNKQSNWGMSVTRLSVSGTSLYKNTGVSGKEGTSVVAYNLASSFKGATMDESGSLFNQLNMGKVKMKQSDMGGSSPYWRQSSCNQCAFDLLVQNSGLITDSKYQCSGLVRESDTAWKAYCDALKNSVAWNGDISSANGIYAHSLANELDFFKGLTDSANWSSISGTSLDSTELEMSDQYIVKWGSKALTDMTKDEVSAMLKAFYNNDYFVILGIRDKDSSGNAANANGPAEYRGAHVVLFAGCKNREVFFNDSSHGKITSYTNDKDLYPDDSTPIRWMYAIKVNNGSVSTKSICGGGSVAINSTDKKAVENLGVSPSVLEKTIDSDSLIASYCKLMEADLESVLDGVNRDNLTGDQLDSLHTWEELNADSSRQGGVLYWIRVVIMWMGIALIIWAVLLYVSFWFDRANNFIDISFVTILTLGKLTTSDTDEEYTYGDKDSKGIKTINSRILTKICILSILVGVLIVSGTLYSLIAKLVNIVTSFISKGG